MQADPNESPNSEPSVKPKATWYVLGLLILVLGPLWALSSLYHTISQPFPDEMKLHALLTEITVDKTGDYTLYEHVSFGWPTFSKQDDLFKDKSTAPTEQYQFKVYKPGGDPIAVQTMDPTSWLKIEWKKNLDFYAARATVHFDQPGQYMIAIANPTQSKFVLARISPQTLYQPIIANSALFIVSFIFGPFILFTVFFLRKRYRALSITPNFDPIQHRKTIQECRVFAAFLHTTGLFGYLFPFGHLIAPTVFYWMSARRHPLMKKNYHAVINFQLTMTLLVITNTLLFFLTSHVFGLVGLVFLLSLFGMLFLHIALTLLGVVMSFKDGVLTYPIAWRFLKDK